MVVSKKTDYSGYVRSSGLQRGINKGNLSFASNLSLPRTKISPAISNQYQYLTGSFLHTPSISLSATSKSTEYLRDGNITVSVLVRGRRRKGARPT